MKKILLVGLIGVALFGCGKKKVTEKMLIGNWECSITEQRAKWENGGFQNYSAPIDHGKSVVTFLKENDDFFVKWSSTDEIVKEDFKKLNKSFNGFLAGIQFSGFNGFEYISDNEFKMISELVMRLDEKEKNEKNKILKHCTRIQ
ncbi:MULTISPECIES: hypothetical protein [unclassified Gilliamella]|uniref:hypothetical protein n=1 Tax=unclassified Gilliamella TaxID=2685620 RepID=UPI0013218BA1|nr:MULTISPECIES: hypothetical protein [unclassified Gilliamella]MWN30858.1 hypothetical protein [Gilliamella sp. Pra-s60]MWP28577.1 hypothetical protein [Gilliamella sp. Pra-s54]